MKRFYETAAPGTSDETDDIVILLDDRPVRTPERKLLALRSAALAEAIASEWVAQGENIDMASMPLTRMASSAVDRVTPKRVEFIDQLARYAETDLVCYRAPTPADLVARQEQSWQPLVDWVARRFAAPLTVTADIAPVTQPDAVLGGLRSAVEAFDDFELAGLGVAVQAAGSLVIGLALAHDEIDADAAAAASQLDEIYQIEIWGEDSDLTARLAGLRADIGDAAQFLDRHRAG